MLSIEILPALQDNYIYLLHSKITGETACVDPGEAAPVQAALASRGWPLDAIFLTHHHHDHIGATDALRNDRTRVIGCSEDAQRLPALTQAVHEGEQIDFAGDRLEVLFIPGHTLGHIAFYSAASKAVFCGDTLFSLGCGRMFEGNPAMMHDSLQKLAALPDETRVYCGHEYTLSNARFALSVEPENETLQLRQKEAEALRAQGKPTLPSTIGMEKAVNPFLRTHSAEIRKYLGMESASDVEVFAELRGLKDNF